MAASPTVPFRATSAALRRGWGTIFLVEAASYFARPWLTLVLPEPKRLTSSALSWFLSVALSLAVFPAGTMAGPSGYTIELNSETSVGGKGGCLRVSVGVSAEATPPSDVTANARDATIARSAHLALLMPSASRLSGPTATGRHASSSR